MRADRGCVAFENNEYVPVTKAGIWGTRDGMKKLTWGHSFMEKEPSVSENQGAA